MTATHSAATPERWQPMIGSATLSLVVHTLLLLLFSLATWAVHTVDRPQTGELFDAQLAAPMTPIGLQGGFRFEGTAGVDVPDSAEPGPDTAGLSAPTSLSRVLEQATVDVKTQPLNQGPTSSTLGDALLKRTDLMGRGVSGEGEGAGGGRGAGTGRGDRDLAGGGPVGSLWGVGQGQNARSVVYVMDRSGSMMDTFHQLQRELMRAIGALNQDQLFEVIWFNEGRPTELFGRLKTATMENKREAFEAIKRIVPTGQTHPLDAVKRALAHRPDVMFLLSDGDFGDDNRRIVTALRQLNKDQRTRVNTILFVYDTMGDGERVLREIAETNRGSYKHVTEKDLRP